MSTYRLLWFLKIFFSKLNICNMYSIYKQMDDSTSQAGQSSCLERLGLLSTRLRGGEDAYHLPGVTGKARVHATHGAKREGREKVVDLLIHKCCLWEQRALARGGWELSWNGGGASIFCPMAAWHAGVATVSLSTFTVSLWGRLWPIFNRWGNWGSDVIGWIVSPKSICWSPNP